MAIQIQEASQDLYKEMERKALRLLLKGGIFSLKEIYMALKAAFGKVEGRFNPSEEQLKAIKGKISLKNLEKTGSTDFVKLNLGKEGKIWALEKDYREFNQLASKFRIQYALKSNPANKDELLLYFRSQDQNLLNSFLVEYAKFYENQHPEELKEGEKPLSEEIQELIVDHKQDLQQEQSTPEKKPLEKKLSLKDRLAQKVEQTKQAAQERQKRPMVAEKSNRLKLNDDRER